MNRIISFKILLITLAAFGLQFAEAKVDLTRVNDKKNKSVLAAKEFSQIENDWKDIEQISNVLGSSDPCIIALFQFSELRSSLVKGTLINVTLSPIYSKYVSVSLRFGYTYTARKISLTFANDKEKVENLSNITHEFLCSGDPDVLDAAINASK